MGAISFPPRDLNTSGLASLEPGWTGPHVIKTTKKRRFIFSRLIRDDVAEHETRIKIKSVWIRGLRGEKYLYFYTVVFGYRRVRELSDTCLGQLKGKHFLGPHYKAHNIKRQNIESVFIRIYYILIYDQN